MNREELGEKIKDILHSRIERQVSEYLTDRIMNLIPTYPDIEKELEGWEVEEECSTLEANFESVGSIGIHQPTCTCHGTGKIRIPLRMEDVYWGALLESSWVQAFLNADKVHIIKSGGKIVRKK